MKSIIIAYPNKESAVQLKSVLEREGFYVSNICTTGASVLSIAGDLRDGVIVCASILKDTTAASLADDLPAGFDVVALTKGGKQVYMGNYLSLPLPLNRQEFISTVAVLVSSQSSFTNRKKNDEEYISNAKSFLMSVNNMSEMQAHKYLQKLSMKEGKKMVDVAKQILSDITD